MFAAAGIKLQATGQVDLLMIDPKGLPDFGICRFLEGYSV